MGENHIRQETIILIYKKKIRENILELLNNIDSHYESTINDLNHSLNCLNHQIKEIYLHLAHISIEYRIFTPHFEENSVICVFEN